MAQGSSNIVAPSPQQSPLPDWLRGVQAYAPFIQMGMPIFTSLLGLNRISATQKMRQEVADTQLLAGINTRAAEKKAIHDDAMANKFLQYGRIDDLTAKEVRNNTRTIMANLSSAGTDTGYEDSRREAALGAMAGQAELAAAQLKAQADQAAIQTQLALLDPYVDPVALQQQAMLGEEAERARIAANNQGLQRLLGIFTGGQQQSPGAVNAASASGVAGQSLKGPGIFSFMPKQMLPWEPTQVDFLSGKMPNFGFRYGGNYSFGPNPFNSDFGLAKHTQESENRNNPFPKSYNAEFSFR